MDICGKADHLRTVGRPMWSWEETGKCTMATHRGKGPGMLRRIRGDNVGKGHLPAGAGSNLQGPIERGQGRRGWEGFGLAHESVGAKRKG